MMLRSVACCCGMLLWLVACADRQGSAQSPHVYDRNGVRLPEVDESEGGAVLCGRMIYLSMYGTMQHCNDPRLRTVLPELRNDIDRIDRFIVENTPNHPGLEAQRKATEDELAQRVKYKANVPACERLSSQPDESFVRVREEYKKGTDALLAVPRLPVMNPCL